MANPSQTHDKPMANPWQTHGKPHALNEFLLIIFFRIVDVNDIDVKPARTERRGTRRTGRPGTSGGLGGGRRLRGTSGGLAAALAAFAGGTKSTP